MDQKLMGIIALVALGAIAQWVAWLLRFPAILLLLTFGFVIGPVARFLWPDSAFALSPDELFGDILLPFASTSVALILFEGGLTLNVRELRGVGRVVTVLMTLGAAVTFVLGSAAAYLVAKFDFGLSILLGAILVVTGPTVILPLLRHIKPKGAVGPILKWEGIVTDPIGALVAVLVFELISEGRYDYAAHHLGIGAAKTILMAGGIGVACAAMLVVAIKRYWVPEHLQALCTTAMVLSAFAGANLIQEESGLFAVTVMGIALANQRHAHMGHILAFKENLRVFLLSLLFVVLSARIQLADLAELGGSVILFVVVLILVVRPICIAVATVGSSLQFRERLFLSWMAPRGIVAAAVTSVFGLALEKAGNVQARLLVPTVFATIVGTVVVYGLTAPWLARKLGLADVNPQGVLILGSHGFGRALAHALNSRDIRTLLVDTNRANIHAGKMEGLNTHHGSILSENALDQIDLAGIGKFLAITSNNEVNSLAVQRLSSVFGRAELFQLCESQRVVGKSDIDPHLQGRLLFDKEMSYARIESQMEAGAKLKVTRLTEAMDFESVKQRYARFCCPLCLITEAGRIVLMTVDEPARLTPGQTVVSMVLDTPPPPIR